MNKSEKEENMKITFEISSTEIEEIIKKHIAKEFPIDIAEKDVFIRETYGTYTVEVEDKIEEPDTEATNT